MSGWLYEKYKQRETPSMKLAHKIDEVKVSNPAVQELLRRAGSRNPANERNARGYVYYMGDGNGRVKIGFSANPWSRLSEAKRFNPTAKILTVEFGTRTLERKRHQQFRDEHLALEWFNLSERLEDWIKSIAATHGLARKGSFEFCGLAEKP